MRSADLDLPVVPLELGSFDVIAEIKNRSPSEGALVNDASSRSERAAAYAEGGAAAISVLTEPTQFAGELVHLEEVVRAVKGNSIPVMRKDFLVDPVQILEARAVTCRTDFANTKPTASAPASTAASTVAAYFNPQILTRQDMALLKTQCWLRGLRGMG